MKTLFALGLVLTSLFFLGFPSLDYTETPVDARTELAELTASRDDNTCNTCSELNQTRELAGLVAGEGEDVCVTIFGEQQGGLGSANELAELTASRDDNTCNTCSELNQTRELAGLVAGEGEDVCVTIFGEQQSGLGSANELAELTASRDDNTCNTCSELNQTRELAGLVAGEGEDVCVTIFGEQQSGLGSANELAELTASRDDNTCNTCSELNQTRELAGLVAGEGEDVCVTIFGEQQSGLGSANELAELTASRDDNTCNTCSELNQTRELAGLVAGEGEDVCVTVFGEQQGSLGSAAELAELTASRDDNTCNTCSELNQTRELAGLVAGEGEDVCVTVFGEQQSGLGSTIELAALTSR